ncbi:MAG: hypothetical protein ACOVP5_07735, partial [Chitinophagales bacterium]
MKKIIFFFLILKFEVYAAKDPNLELVNLTKIYETAVNINRQGDYSKALSISSLVIQRAIKGDYQGLYAKATTLQAKILFAQKNDKARPKFELSNFILEKNGILDKQLMIENYTHLILIAGKNRNATLSQKYEDKLVQLRSKFFEIAHLNKSLETVNLSEFDKEKLAKLKLQTLTIEMQEELDSNAITIDQMSQVQLKSKLIMDTQKNQMMNVMYADSLKNERLKLKDLTILEANSKRNFFATAFVFILFILAISLFLYLKLKKTSKLLEEKNKLIKEKNKLIEIESEKSESLLLNILPSNIVQELKEYGHSKAKNHEAVCVGFLDLVSFTKISAKTNPQTVLDNLNFCFKAF